MKRIGNALLAALIVALFLWSYFNFNIFITFAIALIVISPFTPTKEEEEQAKNYGDGGYEGIAHVNETSTPK